MEAVKESKTTESKEVTAEQAIAVLNQKEAENREKCIEEVNAVTNKYGYTFRVVQSIELTPIKQ